MERPPRLLPVPLSLLHLAGTLLGKSAEVSRLLGSLAVDSSRIRQELDWQPPYSLHDGIAQTVRAFQLESE
jgi:UDP-glucose 4-epimerase